MKTLVLTLCLVSITAQAEKITHGAFGDDGATGLSIPLKTSAQNAADIYNALDVKTDEIGSKEVSVKDGSAIVCKKPTVGVSGTLHASCEFVLRANTKAKVTTKNKKTLRGDVVFTGEIAGAMIRALKVDIIAYYMSYAKKVGNLHCFSAPTVGQVSCDFKNAVLSQSN